jgi:hypothetical protein
LRGRAQGVQCHLPQEEDKGHGGKGLVSGQPARRAKDERGTASVRLGGEKELLVRLSTLKKVSENSDILSRKADKNQNIFFLTN